MSGASVAVAIWRTRSLGAAKGHGRQGVAASNPVRHLATTAWRTRSHSAAGTPSSPSHGPFLTKPWGVSTICKDFCKETRSSLRAGSCGSGMDAEVEKQGRSERGRLSSLPRSLRHECSLNLLIDSTIAAREADADTDDGSRLGDVDWLLDDALINHRRPGGRPLHLGDHRRGDVGDAQV